MSDDSNPIMMSDDRMWSATSSILIIDDPFNHRSSIVIG
jgi:hypothetical protein